MITAATQGRSVVKVKPKGKMTVESVLKEAEMAAHADSTITVDGKPANLKTPVSDESVVVVTSKITNG